MNLGMSNPYLGEQANAITQQTNQSLQNTVLPAVNGGAMAAGGFGGSRHGIAQGLAMGQSQQGLSNALANLYGSAYKDDQANATQRYGYDTSAAASRYGSDNSLKGSMYGSDNALKGSMYGSDKSAAASMYGSDQSAAASKYNADNAYKIAGMNNSTNLYGMNQDYDLGLRSNDLGYATLDSNIAQRNFDNQLASANFGMGVNNTMNQNNQTGINAGTNIQNTPLDYQKYFTNSANGVGAGFGTNTGSVTAQGNPYAAAIGGATMGNSLYNSYKG